MYLKKLELVGFKSFADRTEFSFSPGVTAIVGPNGCGKSNVVDAFKWIFGEQSAKGLRGEEMKDVIFNGTQSRKPLGFGEVTVIFDNEDRSLDLDYAEVAITRRLYRSGESEYLINKQKCRLRDIKELFLDTGLGTSSYSMLEQGKIDVLLQASTLDRRIIFEEAAGISKYRVKKAETLRALERTAENLSRLGDIIDEVEKRMHRLKIQAGKARRYREHSDRLRALRVRGSVEDFRVLLAERVDLSTRRWLADARLGRREELGGRLREGLERHRQARAGSLRALKAIQESLAEARTARERTEERILQDERRLGELVSEREARLEESRGLAAERVRVAEDLARQEVELDAMGEEIRGARSLLEERSGRLEELRLAVEARSRAVEERREAILEYYQERSQVGNRLAHIQSELRNLDGRRERTSRALEEARRESGVHTGKARGLEEELAAARGELARLDAKRAELEALYQSCQVEIAAAEEELSRLAGQMQDRRSRLEVLASFEEKREGIVGGVQAVLASRDQLSEGSRIRGLVADFLRVDRRCARAVEAVLGDRAQSLLVETQEGGLLLLSWAQASAGGGVEVVALDRLAAAESEGCDRRLVELLREAGVIGFLRDQIEALPGQEELLDRLFEGVILVEDLPTAVALSRNGLRPYRLVTLDGSRVEPWGAMSVASTAADSARAAGGIISRRSEIQELEGELHAFEAELRSVRARRDGLVESRDRLELDRRRAMQEREAEAMRISGGESSLAQVRREAELAERQIRVGESELAELVAEDEKHRAGHAAASAELEVLDLRQREAEAIQRQEEEALAASRTELDAHTERVTEAKVRLAEAEERGEGLRRSLAQLRAALLEEERREGAIGAQIEDLLRRHEETTRDLGESRSFLSEVLQREAELRERAQAAEEADRESASLEEAFGREVDRARAFADEARAEREQLTLREQEGKHRRNSLVERIAEEYGLDLARISSGEDPFPAPAAEGGPAKSAPAPQPSPPADGRAPVETAGTASTETVAETVAETPAVEPPVPAAAPETPWWEAPWNREEADQEISSLREKLRNLGNVNLEALDELADLETRHRDMSAQREDLLKADRDLKGIIAEINRTSRELFQKTFEDVQRHFGELFRKCFGGGMAELVLEEGQDILEAGIEIVARPPGKKLTSLSLMSGGEKTMTTIALVFAIFQARPSPFCLLDEVDAPLDENNVRRFVVILREFIRNTQFVIITHNKITMAEADQLFGVTMQERGVSKRVAVSFESYDPERPESLTGASIEEESSDNAGAGEQVPANN